MKNSDRIVVYIVGFVLGTILVSMILTRRAAKEERGEDPWVRAQQLAMPPEAEGLPDGVPDSIREGQILNFGYLPDADAPEEKVWLLNFDKSYPYVRVVETIGTGEISYMAADQILIQLSESNDVTELKPMLDALELRLRMFNRAERVAVVGVVSTALDAVPATLEAVRPYEDLFESAGPDWILFKKSPE